ncbi:signal peptidase I [Gordonia phthalatica]|uniref:Signal peptidase I n=1 Tax=Gordonia phthalatica TaxID=1136941 RepID=A0A0N9NES0_9ACTN|nr:signal peptidase I [Gordonia phthalatica]ALG84084.1 signal peptidase I [Gordonia phthalatica]
MTTTDAPSTSEAPDETSAESKSTMYYVWQTVSWLLLAAAFAVLCATILVPKIGGAQPYTVLTGSMRPSYPPGTLIVVKRVNPNSLAVGDVVTYQIRSGDPEVVTHRIVETTTAPDGERRFITRGDANNTNDKPAVRPVQIRGKLWYSIPYLGFVNTWFTGVKRTVVVFVLAGLLFLYGAWQFYCDWRDDRRKKAEDEATAGPADEAPTVAFSAISDDTSDTVTIQTHEKEADQ